jgi:predicted regulator of amino acid metabolism with ACT domain
MSGWIKLHRTINKWGWKKSPTHVAVFVDILLMANHEQSIFKGVVIPRGSLTTSTDAIAERTGVSRQTVRTILNHLKSTNELTIITNTKFTMISVTNWDEYQVVNQETNKQLTNDQPTTNKQLTTSKNLIIKEPKKKRILSIIEKSPLAFLFKENDPIQEWLISEGSSENVQLELAETISHHVLAEEVKTAYQWQLEREPRNAGLFLKNWIKNKKTTVYKPNQGKAAFKSKSNTVTTTTENPTGSPYLQEAIDKGLTA